MIREVLVTAIALVAAWNSSSLVFARVDESQFRQPVPRVAAHRSSPTPHSALHAIGDAQPTLSENRFKTPASMPSPLALRSASSPLPRPAQVETARPHPRPATAVQILKGAPIPLPPASLRNASDLSCIAVAIYHEARNQDDFGQRAVASVILQRAALPHRWGRTACETIVPTQFNFLTSRYDYPLIDDMDAWQKAVQFAALALVEGPMPELKGADHYHTTAITPEWAPHMVRVRLIDDHIFYVDPRSSAL
ncbi:cell wall hydrolase [Paracoccus benzoatiresistens]|uniref:Cell wall hydrolase n=1 Tax=Paracoccus benzoatiresistens TaxID=2997341 RepID=A0ABT4JAV5_9RHOB|nr:cell wall hydrolase [Paracoccus sp. EF6]MCZ0964263.1 cell wall hydrolase [Paracoccus sp. EF6]